MENKDENFYKEQYFAQINGRFDTLEKKVDVLITRVVWIYAWSAGVGSIAAIIINFFLRRN